MPGLADLKKDLRKQSDLRQAQVLQRFFKTGKGEYGEGDVFLGVKVPKQRAIAKKYWKIIGLTETEQLIQSKIHEERLTGVFILVLKYKKADQGTKKEIVDFYLKNSKKINNWDLVDSSAHYIIGDYLLDKKPERKILYKLARSKNLWEKRIGIMSTFAFIRANEYEDSLKISEILLKDDHDLIHKAVGWMLREVGNRDLAVEEGFLKKHCGQMPRTMLRYAIEKFPEKKRIYYLNCSKK